MSIAPKLHLFSLVLAVLGLAGFAVRMCAAQPSPMDVSAWQGSGLSMDANRSGPDGAASIAVAPKAKAVLPLRDGNDSGKVTFYVYDDGTVASPGKKNGTGPRWGLVQSDGRVFVAGIMYARYLQDEGSLTLIDVDPAVPNAWFGLKYLSGRAKPGWQKWEFNLDSETGLGISINGKALDKKRFDWNASKVTGFTGLVLYGDEAANPQTLWVSGIEYALGGPMKVAPVPPSPAPPVVPASDPAPEGIVPEMSETLRGKHPRLLLTEADLPRLREFYRSEAGSPWRKKIEAYLPTCKPPKEAVFLSDATDGQRQGFWRLPTVALHYLMTGDQESLKRTKGFLEMFLSLPDWETGKERNSGMSAGNIMIGAALAYDWVYNDLDPVFREKFAQKLLWQARAMYHGGHLKKNSGPHYWQNDPANNHRWHRNAGMMLSILAVYENQPEQRWILQQAVNDVDFVVRWLPHDGTCHEGPGYLTFGGNHLVLALDAADRCLGTTFLQTPYLKNTGLFRTHVLLPGMKKVFAFGDAPEGAVGGYNNFFLKAAAVNRQADVKDALLRLLEIDDTSFEFGWFSLLWDDPSLSRGNMENLATTSFWPDIGFATLRTSWKDDAVGASFKCGPFGGRDLNRYAQENKSYINVAHDDPDANEFLIAMGGDLIVKTDGYAKHKASRSHNTILVNDLGQMAKGRPEGLGWSQPSADSMTEMGVITAWRDAGDIVGVEGEASGSYLAYKDKKSGASRPALDRYRRTFLWVKGGYILVLDDIRAPEPVNIDWLVQGERLEPADTAQNGRFVLKTGTQSCEFQIVADKALSFTVQDSPADNRGTSLGYRQLKASVTAGSVRVASVYNPWQIQGLGLRLESGASPDEAVVIVEGAGIKDRWSWKAGADRFKASTIKATRENGPATGFPFLLEQGNSLPPK